MRKIIFLLAGISLFYSTGAVSEDIGGENLIDHNNPEVYDTPQDTLNYDDISKHEGLGNAGHTQGIGNDDGGGNGHPN